MLSPHIQGSSYLWTAATDRYLQAKQASKVISTSGKLDSCTLSAERYNTGAMKIHLEEGCNADESVCMPRQRYNKNRNQAAGSPSLIQGKPLLAGIGSAQSTSAAFPHLNQSSSSSLIPWSGFLLHTSNPPCVSPTSTSPQILFTIRQRTLQLTNWTAYSDLGADSDHLSSLFIPTCRSHDSELEQIERDEPNSPSLEAGILRYLKSSNPKKPLG